MPALRAESAANKGAQGFDVGHGTPSKVPTGLRKATHTNGPVKDGWDQGAPDHRHSRITHIFLFLVLEKGASDLCCVREHHTSGT